MAIVLPLSVIMCLHVHVDGHLCCIMNHHLCCIMDQDLSAKVTTKLTLYELLSQLWIAAGNEGMLPNAFNYLNR